jgi:hypothetical protein
MKAISNYRPSPALAVSILALAVASVGTAGALPGKGKVKANDLAKNSVKEKAIKTGAVSSRTIAAGAVSSEKLGPVGVVTGPTDAVHDSVAGDGIPGGASSSVQCPPGSKITGGGVQTRSFSIQPVDIESSYPSGNDTWSATGSQDAGPGGGEITAYALCLD